VTKIRCKLGDTGGKAAPMTTPTKPSSKTLRVNGLALHYLEWGEADGLADLRAALGVLENASADA
jgi:hypothetical protein